MKRVAFRVVAGILFAASSLHCLADPATNPLPALELVNTTGRLAPGAESLLLVVRRDNAAGKAVSLRAPEGARLWQADADGACSGSAAQKPSLELPAGAANPALVCFSMKVVATGVRVVATATTGNTVYNAATQPFDIAELPSASVWDKPGVSVILSALVGFLFGLGSSWFQVWFDTWKEARVARADAQKFIASSLFPELHEHAVGLAQYFAAAPAELKKLCTNNLKVPQTTAALADDRLPSLTSYFASVSHGQLKADLGEYDKNLTEFNRWADTLRVQNADVREPDKQKLIAGKLRDSLKRRKIA